MPQVFSGKRTEPSFELKLSKDLIAIRTRSRRSLSTSRGPVPELYSSELQSCELVAEYPESGVEVYRVPSGREQRTMSERKNVLRSSPDIQFVGGVLIDPKTKEPVLYTENLFIKFADDQDPDECEEQIRQAGLSIKQQVTRKPQRDTPFYC
ncbi:MAG: hypothetical protein ACK578_03825 [Pirellula sp.]